MRLSSITGEAAILDVKESPSRGVRNACAAARTTRSSNWLAFVGASC
jgi:hypothetical protein